MSEITLLQAVNQALSWELEHDKSVVIFGEDIAKNGGVFRTTVGLLEKFGPERVLDTPIAETAIGGMAIGMATQGLRPVAEFQFSSFSFSALDHIANHAARMRNRTRGRLNCPIVYRMPYGGNIGAVELHSESPEALFSHMAGLRVVIPSSPARAYGLLLAAIRDPDPVIFLEPKRIYRAVKQAVADDGKALPLDKCFVLREGKDVTLIAWGAMVHDTLAAAEQLASKNIQAEVIDLATIKPIDLDTILTSVEKTGRAIIIHEAARFCGVGAEVAAQIAEHGLFSLTAPIQRITGFDTIVPYPKLEKFYFPNVEKIVRAVTTMLEA